MKIIKNFKMLPGETEVKVSATMISHYLGVDVSAPLEKMSMDDISKLVLIRVALLKTDRTPMFYADSLGWVESNDIQMHYYSILDFNRHLLAWSNPGIFKFDFSKIVVEAVSIGYEVGTPLLSHILNFQLPRLLSSPVNLSRSASRVTENTVMLPANIPVTRVSNCFVHEPTKSPQQGTIDVNEKLIHVRQPLTREGVLIYYQLKPLVQIAYGDDYTQVPALPSIILRIRDFERRRVLAGTDYMWVGNFRLFKWEPMDIADLNIEVSVYGEKSPDGYQDVTAILEQIRPLCNAELYSIPHDLSVFSQVTSGIEYLSSEASLSGVKFNLKLLNLVMSESNK